VNARAMSARWRFRTIQICPKDLLAALGETAYRLCLQGVSRVSPATTALYIHNGFLAQCLTCDATSSEQPALNGAPGSLGNFPQCLTGIKPPRSSASRPAPAIIVPNQNNDPPPVAGEKDQRVGLSWLQDPLGRVPLGDGHKRQLVDEFALLGQREAEFLHDHTRHPVMALIPTQIASQIRGHDLVRRTDVFWFADDHHALPGGGRTPTQMGSEAESDNRAKLVATRANLMGEGDELQRRTRASFLRSEGAEAMTDTNTNCAHCKQDIASPHTLPVTPLSVNIRDPKGIGELKVNFCCWQCFAQWTNQQAGGILMPDLDHPSGFFRAESGQMRKWCCGDG
jgi:hypothetical protein